MEYYNNNLDTIDNLIEEFSYVKKELKIVSLWDDILKTPQNQMCISTNNAIDNNRCLARVRIPKTPDGCVQRQCKLKKNNGDLCMIHKKIFDRITSEIDKTAMIYLPDEKSELESTNMGEISPDLIMEMYTTRQNSFIRSINTKLLDAQKEYKDRIRYTHKVIGNLEYVKNYIMVQMKQQIYALERNIRDKDEKLSSNVDKIALLEDEKNTLIVEKDSMEILLSTTRNELTTTKISFEDESISKRKLQTELEQKNTEMNEAGQRNTEMKTEIERLTTKLEECEKSRNELREKITLLTTNISKLTEDIRKKTEEYNIVTVELDTCKNQNTELTTTIDEKLREHNILQGKYDELSTQYATLKDNYTTLVEFNLINNNSMTEVRDKLNDLGIILMNTNDCLSWMMKANIELEEHQSSAASKYLESTHKKMLLLHNTGLGKTWTSLAIASCLVRSEVIRNIVVVSNQTDAKETFKSTIERMINAQEALGIQNNMNLRNVQYVTKTFSDDLPRDNVLYIFDEIDKLVSLENGEVPNDPNSIKFNTLSRFIAGLEGKENVYLLGMTATPFQRTDRQGESAILRKICKLLRIPDLFQDNDLLTTSLQSIKDYVHIKYRVQGFANFVQTDLKDFTFQEGSNFDRNDNIIQKKRDADVYDSEYIELVSQLCLKTASGKKFQRKAIVYKQKWSIDEKEMEDIPKNVKIFRNHEAFRDAVPGVDTDEVYIMLADSSIKTSWNSKFVSDVFLFSYVTISSFIQILGRARRIDSHPTEPDFPINVTEIYTPRYQLHLGRYDDLVRTMENNI